MSKFTKQIEADGYAVVPTIFSKGDLESIREVIRHNPPPSNFVWDKDLCANSLNFYNIASHPSIIERLRSILGEDIILWGGSLIERVPGQVHNWHTDIESSTPDGGFVTIWIGIEGLNKESSLKLVPGSHQFGSSLQEAIQTHDASRETTTDADVERWSQEFDSDHQGIVQPDVTDGDAIFFDGRLWHGSKNENSSVTRKALLFQYARADAAVRIPDFRQLDWPFRFFETPKPPCITVSGQADPAINKIAERPPEISSDLPTLRFETKSVDFSQSIPDGAKMDSTPLFTGRSQNLQLISAHYSILGPDELPHPPHAHVDEEFLIVLQGEASLRYEDDEGRLSDHKVTAGEYIYYPSSHQHTIYNHGNEPVVYLMFKWVGPKTDTKKRVELQRFRIDPISETIDEEAFLTRDQISGQTNQLKLLHTHVSTLSPGGGYDAHADEHDVAIIVIEGQIETNGQSLGPGGVVWHSAGELHDMWNRSEQPARYWVIEFHGENCSGDYSSFAKPPRKKSLAKKRSFGRILKNIKRLLGFKV